MKTEAYDKTIYGTMLSELYHPNLMKIFAVSGFDYVIVDCEHGSFDYSHVATMAAMAKGSNIMFIVRVPEISRECILKYMDAGADGLLLPMITGVDHVRQAITYAKYPPIGQRGLSTQRMHSEYCITYLRQYMKTANERTMLFAQVETVEALRAVELLASIEGLDGLMLGPNDLLLQMGIPGDYGNPSLLQAMTAVSSAASRAGKLSGIISSRKELIENAQRLRMQMLSWNSEIGLLMQAAKAGLHQFRTNEKSVLELNATPNSCVEQPDWVR